MMRDEKSKRRLWQLMMETSAALLAPGAARIPRVVTLTSAECPRPFAEQPGQFWGGSHTADVLLLVDHKPRDFVATHKITEAMALGGSGGCIPVFVLARSTPNGHGMLPYTRWLDYCSVAYVGLSTDAAAD
ncbi:hypothetical protein Ctob_013304 [Chrysochromulina tobinii]|uniref:Uncharacterized protein n=1 Tax=Chrysochromulina tobinii TaxID=1460289 RepID=A0A0M0JUD2_9EUKA|nr:hypothetical protein Ctob_013304 [Chrysochromulina tobinii]|eukprot:KOO30120.1 hypothetical protein Ctob_013304 [Chrysochromulina sp. CCMP291]